ncbi:hypothetical protein BJX61DRAFT_545095 [Aspergillus egyptiacus]|nr:hypothetical protein BJX61DRAFT_545095 [Aspergillus egyptiacus]
MLGPTDILVNNTKYILEGLSCCSHEEIIDQFDTVFSQIRILRAVLPFMHVRKSGVVANLGSIRPPTTFWPQTVSTSPVTRSRMLKLLSKLSLTPRSLRKSSRLALGRDALAAISASVSREEETLDGWKEIIGFTDCDHVKYYNGCNREST